MKLDVNLEREIINNILNDKENSLGKVLNEKITELEKNINNKIGLAERELNKRVKNLDNKINCKPIEVNIGTVDKPKNKILHSKFDTIIKILESSKRIEKHIMLVGACGSGKSSLCSDVAEALKIDFYPMSVGLQTTKSDLLGFINAKGEYMTTPIREAFEKGGLLLLDEFDATNPSTVTILNSMLANNVCSFPDKKIEKHKDFICMVACNTYGKGADVNYVGRNRLDASTLDRFIVLNIDYDESLEKNLTQNDKWFKCVQKMRKNIEEFGIKMIVSPRASMQGADLLDEGFTFEEVLEMVILKGANEDIKSKVLKGVSYVEKDSSSKAGNNKQYIRLTFNVDTKKVSADFDSSCQLIRELDWEGPSMYFSKEGEYITCADDYKIFINRGKSEIQLKNGTSFEKLLSIFQRAIPTYSNKEISLYIQFRGSINVDINYESN